MFSHLLPAASVELAAKKAPANPVRIMHPAVLHVEQQLAYG